MTNPHPVDAAIVDGVPVAKADFRGFVKARERIRMADADEVRNTSLSGQFGGLFISSLSANFELNAADTTTADDGSITIIDADGNRFQRAATTQVLVPKRITTAGLDVTLADDETADIIEINNTGSVGINVFLPDATVRTTRIRIADAGGNAATHNLTVKPKSGSSQTIFGQASYVIDGNDGSIMLDVLSDQSGYI